MLVLVALWLLAVLADGAIYAGALRARPRLERWGAGLTASVSLLSSAYLSVLHWQLWLVPAVIGVYRAVNSLRFMRRRLPERELYAVSLRAHSWLVGLQGLYICLWVLVHLLHWQHRVLPAIAALQLLAALILLRASLHTWRHTEPFLAAEPLSDRELPSLSVLIPARNETDALERCLQQLTASTYPKLEIVVLDDNSTTRRTPEIIRAFAQQGVRFVAGDAPDEVHWLPKNQAYDRLRREASGDLLLFCGVDALFEPNSLRQLVQVLLERHKDMVSVLPLKDGSVRSRVSLLQPMRYYWEICLPRRFFKRPPVLSTCWLIRAEALDRAGGFEAERRSITPEAYFARQAVVTDAYSFIRSNQALGIYSDKPAADQYDTSVRMRYPQLHRRLELVALTTLLELGLLVGPVAGLVLCWLLQHPFAYALLWAVDTACLLVTYYLVAVATKLNAAWLAWLLMPAAFVYDSVIQHISFGKYEFSHVEWKGRDVAVPVMHVTPRQPEING